MKAGTLALECHAVISDGRIVVSRAELNIVDAQLKRLTALVSRYGADEIGVELAVGPNCSFGDDEIIFDVVCSEDAGDARFHLVEFLTWCWSLVDADGRPIAVGPARQQRSDIDGRAILSRAATQRLFSALMPSDCGYIDDIVERATHAVRVTTSERNYVVIGASLDDYELHTQAQRPRGKPLGQMPLLPHAEQ